MAKSFTTEVNEAESELCFAFNQIRERHGFHITLMRLIAEKMMRSVYDAEHQVEAEENKRLEEQADELRKQEEKEDERW